MRLSNYFLIVIVLFTAACSSVKESAGDSAKQEPEVYIFHEVAKPDSAKVEKPFNTEPASVQNEIKPPDPQSQKIEHKKFIVQVGAFSTKERAQLFISENKSKISQSMSITLREQSQLFLVQLPPYSSREEAEKVRDALWQYPAFKGAFIITTD